MRGKIILVVGLATGYVLGARAGRERYEQIKVGAAKVWNLGPVQSGVHAIEDFAGERIDAVQTKVVGGARNALAKLISTDGTTAKSGSRRSVSRKPASKRKAASTSAARGAAKKPTASSTTSSTTTDTDSPATDD